MTIGESIRHYRLYNGLTLKQVAAIINIPYQNIQRYEKDVYRPKRKRYIEIVNAVGIPRYIAERFYKM